jgi:3-oxoacyl-[acyl-carrier protein] reductase
VIISDIDAEKASSVANAINNNGGKALAVVGDMLDDAYLKTLVEKAAEFGEGKIHIIVNNAGFTWDGVIHKVCFLPSAHLSHLSMLTRGTNRQQINNGTP